MRYIKLKTSEIIDSFGIYKEFPTEEIGLEIHIDKPVKVLFKEDEE